jgi:hypothetical protein
MNDNDTHTIDLGGFGGAGQPSYTINTGAGVGGSNGLTGGYGLDTITLDPSIYSTSITSPSTITWNSNYTTATNGSWSNTANTANVNIDSNGLTMKAGTDIVIDGRSLSKSIDAIEERLGILNPNPELEERWDQLKVLRKQYIDLEKDLLEKEKLMKILKEK